MLRHIKLVTISWLLAALMFFTAIILVLGALFLERNISLIATNWELFQADRSEKSRLESVLRAAIGYGGMIHEFKNYILRQDPERIGRTQSHIGAAKAVLDQYGAQEISTVEAVALEDIGSVLGLYEKALVTAEQLVASGRSIAEIDAAVQIDDAPALRGLRALRNEIRQAMGHPPPSKRRLNADLRAAMGFGGIIHEFKNYVLRHDAARVAKVEQKLQLARSAIARYRQLAVTNAEALALDDIEATLLDYGMNLDTVGQMIAANSGNKEIDQAVRIDDHLALRGLGVIDREISHQVTIRGGDVAHALKLVEQTLSLSIWIVIAMLAVVVTATVWLMQNNIIVPLLHLTKGMVKLADNDLSVKFDVHYRDNELGDMARTVMVFRENMIERSAAEQRLAQSNEELNERIGIIRKLREDAQLQTDKALSLAEGLVAARENADQERRRVHSIINAVRDAIITIDTRGIIESVNPGTEKIFGYQAAELINQNVSMLVAEPAFSEHDSYIARFVKDGSKCDLARPAEQTAVHKDGTHVEVEITINTIIIDGEQKILGVVRDITERKQWEEQIKKLAMTDPLTGLANRNQYTQRMEEAAALSMRLKQPFALLLIDLDKFKPVNDSYGHAVGDTLLQHVAQQLTQCCRDTDTVARLGGDEFAIILAPTVEILNTDIPARRIITKLSQPVTIEGHSIQIGASIGISTFPDHSDDLETLQTQADQALYEAKQSGRNTARTCNTLSPT